MFKFDSFEARFIDDWTAANLGFGVLSLPLATFASPNLAICFFFYFQNLTLLDLIHIHRNDTWHSEIHKDLFSFQFVDISRPRFEKHGFDRRHQGRGAFFGFDGKGEEAEE